MTSGGNGLYTLATIIKRLEAVASRIEDVADIQEQRSALNAMGSGTNAPSVSAVPVPPPPPPQSAPELVAQPTEVPKQVVAFDELVIDGKFKEFLELTKSFASNSVIEQAVLLGNLFVDLRAVLVASSVCRKPDQKTFGEMLGPIQAGIEAITRMKDSNRRERDWFNHLSTVATGAPCVGWVTVEPKPGPYVNDVLESTQFYGNKVIQEYKAKDIKHAEWVRSFVAILEEMRKYIMQYHATGLVWNPKGVPLSEYTVDASASTGGTVSSPLPPPAPSASPLLQGKPSPSGGPPAIFAELNRGEEVTKGLRKVEKSEMTHKNPALRPTSTVPGPSTTSPPAKKPVRPTKPQVLMGKKPPKFALEGSKWVIEYQENESRLTIENTEINQTVNLFGCKNSTVIIKGKVNAVVIVNCPKTSVLVESVISSVSVTSSPSFTLQITGSAPTIQLDSTDSGQIYLSKDCLGLELLTAKCSSINVSLPVEGEEEGVFVEKPVPEMLRTTIQDGTLVTTVVEHVG